MAQLLELFRSHVEVPEQVHGREPAQYRTRIELLVRSLWMAAAAHAGTRPAVSQLNASAHLLFHSLPDMGYQAFLPLLSFFLGLCEVNCVCERAQGKLKRTFGPGTCQVRVKDWELPQTTTCACHLPTRLRLLLGMVAFLNE